MLLKEVAGVCFVIDKWWGLKKGAAAAFAGGRDFWSSFNLPPQQDAVYFYAHKSAPHTLSTRIFPSFFLRLHFSALPRYITAPFPCMRSIFLMGYFSPVLVKY
jgi:hypothetical protein